MARSFEKSELQSRNARKRIPIEDNPQACYTRLKKGLALGYRKGLKGGTWIARRLEGGTKYAFLPIGLADDAADGVGMSFDDAVDKALEWFRDRENKRNKKPEKNAPYTVAEAMEDYLADYEQRGGKDVKGARNTINAHVVPVLGNMQLKELDKDDVKKWFAGVTSGKPRLFTAKGAEQAYRAFNSKDRDAQRRRKASANRILGVFRAALNYAHSQEVIEFKVWEGVKPHKRVDVAKLHFLSVEDAKLLIQACPDDFRSLVEGALYTGCRYGELTAMNVDAYQTGSKTLLIADSKSGKPRYVRLNDDGLRFFDNLTGNRKRNEAMFVRADGRRWNGGQKPLMDRAVAVAGLEDGVTFHTLRHTHASWLAASGVTEAALALRLGHTSTQMTKRYSHFSDSHMLETAQRLPSFAVSVSGVAA
jgi:integrase